MDKGAENYNRFLAGDEQGLYEIIREYKDGLILYINSIVANLHTAEEVAEDTFVKICLKRPRYIPGGSFKAWLYTIGKRLALDRLRQDGTLDMIQYLERIPDKLIPKKQELIEALRRQPPLPAEA